MKRFSDEEILGLYVPRGLGPARPEGERIQCARLHCAGTDRQTGTRAHRWGLRHVRGPDIELCARCHTELATIIGGG